MTGLLFVFLSATLISQSFMDAMSVVLIIYMLTMRVTNKTQFPSLGTPKSWLKESLFFGTWLLIIALGLWNSPEAAKLFSEWKWIFNLYFMYWFLTYYFNSRARLLFVAQNPKTGKHSQIPFLNFSKILPSESFWQPLHWILLACFVYGLISFATGVDLFKQTPLSHGKRFAGPFDDPMNFAHIYGMYAVFLAPFLLEKLQTFKSLFTDRKRLLLLVTVAATALSVYLTLTRGAWMGVFTGLVVMSFILNWRWGLSVVAAGVVAVLILYAGSGTFRSRMDQTLHPAQSYDSERINLWRSNWEIFKDHPVVGIGHGDYKRFLPVYFEKLNIPADHFQSHAHNQYLQFLSNTGILGLGFYLIFIGFVMVTTYKGYLSSKDPILLGSLGAQIAFHIGSITECNFERAKVRLVYLFFCALALAVVAYNRRQAPLKK